MMSSATSFTSQSAVSKSSSLSVQPTEKYNILLVEDDESMASFLMACIGSVEGYQVEHAANGLHAEKVLRARKIDLIVSDIIMPEVDGLELIRIRNVLTPNTPIIIMTGGSAKLPLMDLPKMAQMLGADAAFHKPIDPAKLLELMHGLLESRRA